MPQLLLYITFDSDPLATESRENLGDWTCLTHSYRIAIRCHISRRRASADAEAVGCYEVSASTRRFLGFHGSGRTHLENRGGALSEFEIIKRTE